LAAGVAPGRARRGRVALARPGPGGRLHAGQRLLHRRWRGAHLATVVLGSGARRDRGRSSPPGRRRPRPGPSARPVGGAPGARRAAGMGAGGVGGGGHGSRGTGVGEASQGGPGLRFDTVVARGARDVPSRSRPLTPPIYQTNVYVFEDMDAVESVWEGKEPGFVY